MNTGKFSPLVVGLMALTGLSIAGMVFVIVSDGVDVFGSPALMLAVVSILLIAVAAVAMVRYTHRRLQEQASQNERNQTAILQLLDELADLAEGDLTVHASVTENFTGAIADSINFAIDQMRGLVSNIKQVSVQVSKAASETLDTARDLEQAAEAQASEIGGATNEISEMAASIDLVSVSYTHLTLPTNREV